MIREASIGDAEAIAVVHVRSWQAAYAGRLPQAYLDGLSVERRRRVWNQILAATDWPQTGTLVAEVEGNVAGFVSISPTRDGDQDPARVGEVGTIYVLAEAWGTGIGRALMRSALDRLTEAGYSAATLWVLDTNDRARHFYEAGPWRLDGATKRDDERGFAIEEVRYACSLPVAGGATDGAPGSSRP
ncbi:MAG: GNAT family N-acetyltransferase [Candidatus Dormibacteraceae bacterium]